MRSTGRAGAPLLFSGGELPHPGARGYTGVRRPAEAAQAWGHADLNLIRSALAMTVWTVSEPYLNLAHGAPAIQRTLLKFSCSEWQTNL